MTKEQIDHVRNGTFSSYVERLPRFLVGEENVIAAKYADAGSMRVAASYAYQHGISFEEAYKKVNAVLADWLEQHAMH